MVVLLSISKLESALVLMRLDLACMSMLIIIGFKMQLALTLLVDLCSKARGGGGGSSPPIGLKSMQNSLFLALLRPIFALKTKIAPPTVLTMRDGEVRDVILSTKTGFLLG